MFFFPKIVLSLHAHLGMFLASRRCMQHGRGRLLTLNGMHTQQWRDFILPFIRPKGEMAEWSIAAVLKTVEVQASGGSNPSLSAVSVVNQWLTKFTHSFTLIHALTVCFFCGQLTVWKKLKNCCQNCRRVHGHYSKDKVKNNLWKQMS